MPAATQAPSPSAVPPSPVPAREALPAPGAAPYAPRTGAGVEVRDLSKSYGRKKALAGVSFSAAPGSFTVILGPGGAGKTTILRLLAGLEPQSGGDVLMNGRSISRLAPRDRDIAMIFDNLALYPDKNGFENMASPLRRRGVPKEEIRRTVYAMAEKLNLTLTLDRLPKTMSGGERQRLALGRAMVRRPSIFLLDEPLSSLDAPLRFMLRSELKRLQREEGHTFLMATPDFHEALAVGDEIVMLHEGEVVQICGPQELYDDPADTRTALFVGAPRINLLPASASGGVVSSAGLVLPVPDRLAGVVPSGPFTLGLRPDNVRVVGAQPPQAGGVRAPDGSAGESAAAAGPAASARCRGGVVDIEFLGRNLALTVKASGELVTVLTGPEALTTHPIGSEAELAVIDPAKLMAFGADGRNLVRRGPIRRG